MPLYEYQCAECGRFEVIRKFSDPALKKCPTCGKPIRKLASAPAIQFKGSGWYVTDYAKSGAKGTKDDAKADPGAKDGAKADSSTAASDQGAAKPTPSKDSPAPSGSGSSKSSEKKSA